jgi:hypothetical protein
VTGIDACRGGTGVAIVLQSYGVAKMPANASLRKAVPVVLIIATYYPHAPTFTSVAQIDDVPEAGKT